VTVPAGEAEATTPRVGVAGGASAPQPHRLAQVDVDDLRFDPDGLVPVVVQQHDTGEVLMVAWADAPALERTRNLGEAVFYSRSRQEQWHKGATSGNTQRVLDVRVDCDADVVLYLVDQGRDGVACHTGERSCFHRRLAGAPEPTDQPGPAPAEESTS
jgi:phosphoribosyl-AMP cyclohydrolase